MNIKVKDVGFMIRSPYILQYWIYNIHTLSGKVSTARWNDGK